MATKLYTGILTSYNNKTKSGVILVDASSDPMQPNIFITGKDLPAGFVFKDTKYKSSFVDGKTVTVNGAPVIMKKEVFEKDAKGKMILDQTKVSFDYDKTINKITNLTIL